MGYWMEKIENVWICDSILHNDNNNDNNDDLSDSFSDFPWHFSSSLLCLSFLSLLLCFKSPFNSIILI